MDSNGDSLLSKVSGFGKSQQSNVSRSTYGNSSILTSPSNLSAYERIFSKKNLRSHLLPEFLKSKRSKEGLRKHNLQLLNLQARQSSDILTSWVSSDSQNEEIMQGNLKSQLNSFSNRLRLNSEKIEQIKIIESLLADILDPNQDPSEIVLKIRSQSLTRGELRSFGHNTDLPENIVNTYMRMLKSSHKRQRTGTSDRVLISKSGLSDDIFSKSREIVHSKPNILNYTYLLFPLFVGSWTLLVFNTKESHVYYYDPIKEHEKIHSLLDRLYNFIQQFLVQNHKVFDETERKGLIYVPVKNHVLYAAKDSGAYVCMQAELLISGKSTIPDIEDYKKDMLVSLIRASLE